MGISGLIQGLMSDPLSTLLYLLISFLAMCISISFHEWAHAFTAYKLGDPTAKNLGRMTLDPFAHLDLMGAIMFVLFGFGWARPVVVNSRNLKHFRRDDVLISLAGPFMNLLLAFVFTGIYYFVQIDGGWLRLILIYLISMNLHFAVFNLIPIYPLDGYHVLTSIFIKNNYKVIHFMQRYGSIILIALIVTGATDAIIGWASDRILSLFLAFFGLFG